MPGPRISRALCSLGLVAALSACGSGRPTAPLSEISAVRYTDPSPPSLTLITSIRTLAGVGAHSALMVNGAQRVIFDPAGSFRATINGRPAGPQRGDVIYGVTPAVLKAYIGFQSAPGFHVVTITIPVSAAEADLALRKVEHHGWVSMAFCADANSTLLTSLPGFKKLHTTMFPRAFMREVAKLPGVKIRTYVSGVRVANDTARDQNHPNQKPARLDF